MTTYSTKVAETERNKSENGTFSINVTWSNTSLSTSDATKNVVTLEFLDGTGNAATAVEFKKEENPLLFMMDMKMMTVAHSNHLCKMQTDALYAISGNKLTISNRQLRHGVRQNQGQPMVLQSTQGHRQWNV